MNSTLREIPALVISRSSLVKEKPMEREKGRGGAREDEGEGGKDKRSVRLGRLGKGSFFACKSEEI